MAASFATLFAPTPTMTEMPSSVRDWARISPASGFLESNEARCRFDDGDLRTKAIEDLSEFAADGPAAEYHQRFGHLT